MGFQAGQSKWAQGSASGGGRVGGRGGVGGWGVGGFGERLSGQSFPPFACTAVHCKHARGSFSPSGGAVYLSGIDMIHGTPVLDIKPYIADYDSPQNLQPLEDLNMQNNRHKPRAVSQAAGTADSCAQRLLSGCGKAQHCQSAEEKAKCLEDRTPEENSRKSRDSTGTQHLVPEDGERGVDLVLESSRGDSVGMAEEQPGPRDRKSSLNEGTDRSGKVDHALALQGSSAETPWASCSARTADRAPCSPGTADRGLYSAGTADRAPCSAVPTWVREAPAASLRVRFTPHADMDLRKLSSGGKLGYLGSPSPE